MVNRDKFVKWTDAQIIKCYLKTNSCSQAAKKLGIGQTTIYRALERNGVERRGLEIYRHAVGRGVLLRPVGNVVYFMPPYVITPDEIDLMVDVAREGIERATCA